MAAAAAAAAATMEAAVGMVAVVAVAEATVATGLLEGPTAAHAAATEAPRMTNHHPVVAGVAMAGVEATRSYCSGRGRFAKRPRSRAH